MYSCGRTVILPQYVCLQYMSCWRFPEYWYAGVTFNSYSVGFMILLIFSIPLSKCIFGNTSDRLRMPWCLLPSGSILASCAAVIGTQGRVFSWVLRFGRSTRVSRTVCHSTAADFHIPMCGFWRNQSGICNGETRLPGLDFHLILQPRCTLSALFLSAASYYGFVLLRYRIKERRYFATDHLGWISYVYFFHTAVHIPLIHGYQGGFDHAAFSRRFVSWCLVAHQLW